LKSYVHLHRIDNHQSFRFKACPSEDSDEEDSDEGEESLHSQEVSNDALKSLSIGLGFFSFYDSDRNTLHALFQAIGEPVASNCGLSRMENIILFGDSEEQIARFLNHITKKSLETKAQTYLVFQWNVRHQFWSRQSACTARSLDSVILPCHIKKMMLDDITAFYRDDTKSFYASHGIPYRRAFLFYGVPGSGKTSFIQALAGHFGCSISIIQASSPGLTDESLHAAVNRLPKRTIAVIEDIDSLFTKNRGKKVESKISFSGLLNALDGVGSSKGQIFILTTNLKDNLDPALIRKGRVDVHVPFMHADNEQMKLMWASYYPGHIEKADDFATILNERLEGKLVAASSLQHFFVTNRLCTAEEALCNVGEIVDELIFQENEKILVDAQAASTDTEVVNGFSEQDEDF